MPDRVFGGPDTSRHVAAENDDLRTSPAIQLAESAAAEQRNPQRAEVIGAEHAPVGLKTFRAERVRAGGAHRLARVAPRERGAARNADGLDASRCRYGLHEPRIELPAGGVIRI